MNLETFFYVSVIVLLLALISAVHSLRRLDKENWIRAFSITIDDMHKTLMRIEDKLEEHTFDTSKTLDKSVGDIQSIRDDVTGMKFTVESMTHTIEQIQRNTAPQIRHDDY